MRAWAFGLVLAAVVVDSPAAQEDFNHGWRFARFGRQADGGTVDEPGAARASSEESGKGNTAERAIDGDPATRWCASGGRVGEWLAVHLGAARRVGSVEIRWEKSERHAFHVEALDEGGHWKRVGEWTAGEGDGPTDSHAIPVDSATEALRVVVDRATDTFWPSIVELRVLDERGGPVEPRAPAAGGPSPAAPGFDDSGWRRLDLPHDWGIEGPFQIGLEGATGKLPWEGIGWYRKRFALPAEDAGRRIFLEVDGAMMDARVWLNGEEVGRWPYGYSSWRMELTAQAKPGAENLLAIRLDNRPDSSRWYPGAGLYRDVRLVRTPPVHVAHNGVFVTTSLVGRDSARVKLRVEIENQGSEPAEVNVTAAIRRESAPGTPVPLEPEQGVRVPAGGRIVVELSAEVPEPRLWSPEQPEVYRADVAVGSPGVREADSQRVHFGIRTMAFTPNDGFLLNGRRCYLKGVCMHHDLGALGSAWNRRAAQRQLELLKEMGCNSIRTSHNPPAPGLVELCDRMGIILQVEAFDCWDKSKRANDYGRFFGDWHERDLRLMVRNFRNHPSVAMWSIGNEIPGGYQDSKDGWRTADRLRAIVHDEDPTRPVTMGNNSPRAGDHLWRGIDLLGYNYKPHLYEKFHRAQPETPVYGAETASCVSSRGVYFFPVDWDKGRGFFDFQVSSYDLYAPSWAMRPDIEFAAQDKCRPFVFGEYVWTGFDYLGEPTPFNSDATNLLNFHDPAERERAKRELERAGRVRCPSRSSYFGIIDLAGLPKDRYYLYQARWRPELPMAHILPHWNWPQRRGQVTPVHVYTSGDEAELFLDGRSLGRRKRGESEFRLVWDQVEYQPGELRVVAYRGGRRWAEAVRRSTGEPAALRLRADRVTIAGDGRDLCFVTVEVVDGAGEVVPTASTGLRFRVDGPGEFVAADNGDATDLTTFSDPRRNAFSGKCVAIVRATRGGRGTATLEVAAEGLPSASVAIRLE